MKTGKIMTGPLCLLLVAALAGCAGESLFRRDKPDDPPVTADQAQQQLTDLYVAEIQEGKTPDEAAAAVHAAAEQFVPAAGERAETILEIAKDDPLLQFAPEPVKSLLMLGIGGGLIGVGAWRRYRPQLIALKAIVAGIKKTGPVESKNVRESISTEMTDADARAAIEKMKAQIKT